MVQRLHICVWDRLKTNNSHRVLGFWSFQFEMNLLIKDNVVIVLLANWPGHVSAKEVTFPPLSVWFVCLCVCKKDHTKTTQWINHVTWWKDAMWVREETSKFDCWSATGDGSKIFPNFSKKQLMALDCVCVCVGGSMFLFYIVIHVCFILVIFCAISALSSQSYALTVNIDVNFWW